MARGIQLRLEETSGKTVRGRVRLPRPVAGAKAVSLLGRPIRAGRVTAAGRNVEFDAAANAVATLAIVFEK